MDWSAIRPELQKKLDPKHIKPAPRGKYGDYVDGYHVISEANRIFGEDGWSYEITRLEMVSEQTVETQKGPQYRVGYLCTVKVYINGTSFKEGSAVGSGVGSPDTIADHHESAVKEAETDALKRALRSYGNTFGLALYDKDKANVGVEPPPRDPKAVAASLVGIMEKAENIEAVNKALGSAKFDGAWVWLDESHPEEALKVRRAVDAARDRFTTKEAAE
jgi:DNA repair and recombination protein RAD52